MAGGDRPEPSTVAAPRTAATGASEGDRSATIRATLVVDPGDAGACADWIRCLDDAPALFRWFRRVVILQGEKVEGDVLRRALLASAAVDVATLARFADSVPFGHYPIPSFVGAALLVNRRVDIERLAAAPIRFARCNSTFERVVAILSEKTVPASVPEAFDILKGKQNLVAVFSTAGFGTLQHAAGLNVSHFVRRIRRNLYGDEFRAFTHHWTFAIGHMVILAFLMKGQDAGVLDFNGVKIWEGSVANAPLWQRMSTLSRTVEFVPRWSTFADNHVAMHHEWLDGRFVDYFEACGTIADRAGDARGAILDRPEPDHPALARFREAAGLAPDDRIVTLNCREPGFRPGDPRDLRNVDPASCLPALADLVARGYRVVRVGDPTMTPLPAMAGVVDYAVSELKSPELDVLLPAAAAFHVGSSSGLSLVPLLFGTPCLFLNWYPFGLLPWGRRNWTVVKPVVALADGRRTVDRNSYARLARLRDRPLLNALGHDARGLEPAEIQRAVAGFVESLEAGLPEPPKSGRNIGRILVADDSGRLRDLA